MNTKPNLFTVEGPDGCGKTTTVRLLVKMLQKTDRIPVSIRTPGGTDKGKHIREAVLQAGNTDPHALTFLFLADFILTAKNLIAPAIRNGHLPILDRFILSTEVYQYYRYPKEKRDAYLLSVIQNEKQELYARHGIVPHHIVLTGLPLSVLNDRIGERNEEITAFERNMQSVIDGYREAITHMNPASYTELPLIQNGRALNEEEAAEKVLACILSHLETFSP